MSLVSVIIPAYNHENFIQETIKSIINQTYQNIELIILDDGSKDSTWAKINEMKDECEKRFSRIIFETKENEGTCKTLNKLINLAEGEYIYLIASDDIAKPHAIEKEVNFLQNNTDYSLVVGDNEIIDKNNKRCNWNKKQEITPDGKFKTFAQFLQRNKPFKFTSNDFGTYKTLYTGNYIPNGYLIRKSIFEITGLFTPEAPLEDWYLMLQISKYSKMKYIDEILFSYRWYDGNTIKNKEKMKMIIQQTLEHEEKILENIDKSKVQKDVTEVINKGVCYKTKGIPYIFEVLNYKKSGKKVKIIKLLNIKIFQH